ncbi:helix-turn-helix domain-containing protein [Bacillus paranthracis]
MFLERHYKLLEYIAYEKKWFSLQEIAQTLNCSVKTVQRDLIQISDYLPDNWYIKTSSKKRSTINKTNFLLNRKYSNEIF